MVVAYLTFAQNIIVGMSLHVEDVEVKPIGALSLSLSFFLSLSNLIFESLEDKLMVYCCICTPWEMN